MPGEYRVRGLFRKDLHLRYEFSVYSPGNPPWSTEDRTGGWLADHTPQADVLSLPKGLLTAAVRRCCWARRLPRAAIAWPGSTWTPTSSTAARLPAGGRYALARDVGPILRSDVHAYSAFLSKGIQVFGLQGEGEDYTQGPYVGHYAERCRSQLPILKYVRGGGPGGVEGFTKEHCRVGLASRPIDHIVAVSLPDTNEILFVDAAANRRIQRKPRRNKPIGRILGKVAQCRIPRA